MTTYTLRASPIRRVLSTLLAHLARPRRRLARAHLQAAARRTLMRLDDATLRDIGVHRTEIASVVAESFGDSELQRLRLSPRQSEGL